MGRRPTAAEKYTSPAVTTTPGSALPRQYAPLVAGYARGPFVTPDEVTPTDWRWRNARTFIVKSKDDGHEYRCVRVVSGNEFIGYWAVELLGIQLPLDEWEPTS